MCISPTSGDDELSRLRQRVAELEKKASLWEDMNSESADYWYGKAKQRGERMKELEEELNSPVIEIDRLRAENEALRNNAQPRITYLIAKSAVDKFEAEFIGQDSKSLWDIVLKEAIDEAMKDD